RLPRTCSWRAAGGAALRRWTAGGHGGGREWRRETESRAWSWRGLRDCHTGRLGLSKRVLVFGDDDDAIRTAGHARSRPRGSRLRLQHLLPSAVRLWAAHALPQ